MLDQTARRYGTRPSTLLGITDLIMAMDFDMAIATRCRDIMGGRLALAASEESSMDSALLMVLTE